MAKTASTGFTFRRSLYGVEHPAPMRFRLANSATVKIGDLVRVNNAGFLVRCATGEVPGGVLVGIVNHDSINPFSLGADAAGATLTPDDQVATKSSNQTDATYLQGEVILDPAGVCLWENTADGTIATTNLFQMFDVANGNQVTSGSASDANGQVQLIAIDPDGTGSTTKGLFRINESQFSMGIDSATAKVAA